ncbi:MAG: HAMP domain-containing sensor histidine kinase, partial [Chthoniobacteraceae bacterium]
TPLNAIIGFTGTLLMELPGPLTEDQREQLELVRSSARHQLSLINDLLDLVKIESGKVVLKLVPVDSREVVREVFASLQPLADTKGLSLTADIPGEPAVIATDRRALSQILINLLSNAIKFTGKGGVRVALRRGNDATELAVSDTGIGIPSAEQAQLFQPFARIENADEERQEGTGLGLHLSRKLAELLHAQITVESEPGKGSTFTLTVPNPAPGGS